MKRTWLERTALCVSAVIVAGWLVFWVIQVMGVIELLRLAYGG